jgi:hypothetical protein
VASIKAEADRRAANVLPIIREAQKAGATTLRQIAEALNARGVTTARGGQRYATSVSNVLNRAEGIADMLVTVGISVGHYDYSPYLAMPCGTQRDVAIRQ